MKKVLVLTIMLVLGRTSFAQPKNETLKIFWPTEYKWKVASNQQNATQQLVELIPGNETLSNWTIIGSMLVMNKIQVPKISTVPNMLFAQTQKRSKTAKLTVLEQSELAANKWVIFKVEASSFINNPKPESQVYYVVQGKSALFVNFVAIKQANIPIGFLNKWSAIFKRSTLIIK